VGEILYRTNSYTGRENPFSTPWYALSHDIEERTSVLSCLSSLSFSCNNSNEEAFRVYKYNNNNINFVTEMSQESFERYCEEFFEIFSRYDENLKYTCWFTTKDIVLSRSNGYGKNLCKESGGVKRCFDSGTTLLRYGFDVLCAYEVEPKLSPDPLINNKLISKAELDELLNFEEHAGRTLAPTCLKKDVLNVLKAARNGLIGDISPDYITRQAVQDRIHDRIIQDLL